MNSPIILFEQPYQPSGKAFDEVATEEGLRPGWSQVLPYLANIPASVIPSIRRQALRLLQQNGVVFNIFGDSGGQGRPWDLELIPHVLSEEEWNFLKVGLAQRARLLNCILTDLYGPLRLVEEGLIPSEIIYGSPAYLRPCHGLTVPENIFLHFYAADVGRLSDGSFCILGDRTQAPVGAGFALENRIVISRLLQSAFQSSHVHRLAIAFNNFRQHLAKMSRTHRDNPFIVLMSPGPKSPNYFEHAYLARYLGFTLVHGEDLAFRKEHIYLKTLSGLQVVDVILRFVNDDLSDPLELGKGLFGGVTGLTQAMRAGHVVVVNAPGVGVVEHPALMAFLPSLCEKLLGEPLKIPSVPTWWCRFEKDRQTVLEQLTEFIIKPVLPEKGVTSIYPWVLSDDERVELRNRIEAQPSLFVGQKKLLLSQAPHISDRGLETRGVSWRSFVVADGKEYTVMPGGLARVSQAPDDPIISDERGGGCKDMWIVSSRPVEAFTLLSPSDRFDKLLRTGGEVVSRVAENLFWLGRYTQRAIFQSCLLRTLLYNQFETSSFTRKTLLGFLFEAVSRRMSGVKTPLGDNDESLFSLDLLAPAFHNESNPSSLSGLLTSVYLSAQSVRDRLTNDAWRLFLNINEMTDELKKSSLSSADTLIVTLDKIILYLTAFEGITSENMTRGQGWRFLEMGKRIELSLKNSALIQDLLTRIIPENSPVLEAFLEITDSLLTYRRRYQTQLEIITVLDIVLRDESNPQSIAYQLNALQNHMTHMRRERLLNWQSPEELYVLDAFSRIRLVQLERLVKEDDRETRPELEAFMLSLDLIINALYEELNRNYLVHSQLSQKLQLSNTPWTG